MNQKVELLAPAGSPEGFYGAIHAGADAVYLGGKHFSARAYADNFTTEEMIACIRYAHIWGRKVYLTANTLVKEAEFQELMLYLQPLYEAGLDGVIVQDIGVLCFIREHFPELALHVSTQMTVTGQYGANLLKKMGAVRIVPARELSLPEIYKLKELSGLEVETFIHGAMCYCYSGQCLFSSILGGRSGNRGRCAQPCRLPYQVVKSGKTTAPCYPLSLKDMCTIEHIPELIETGIDSFKIEGRMKKPEYTAGVTAVYREYIDRYYEGKSRRISWDDLRLLNSLYIRSERQEGYYFRRNGSDMVTLSNPSYSSCSEELLEQIHREFLTESPRMGIGMRAEFFIGKPARLSLILNHDQHGEICVTVEGEQVIPALNQPVTEENVRRQLGKLGDTVFCAETLQIYLDDGAFYPLKALNELRRRAVTRLEDVLIERNRLSVRRCAGKDITSVRLKPRKEKGDHCKTRDMHAESFYFHVSVRTEEQLTALVDSVSGPDMPRQIYLDANLVHSAFVKRKESLLSCLRRLEHSCCHMLIALPPILRMRDDAFLRDLWNIYTQHSDLFYGFLVRSVDGLGFVRRMLEENVSGSLGEVAAPPAVYTDAGLYIWNKNSLWSLKGINGFCMPYELKASEQRKLLEDIDIPCEKVVYGRIPLMLSANCLTNTTEGCQKGRGEPVSFLIDRYKKRFPVLRDCERCMNILYNSLPLSLHGELDKLAGTVDFRLDFTIESGQETSQILRYFMSGAGGEPPFGEYTTGHEKRGVE